MEHTHQVRLRQKSANKPQEPPGLAGVANQGRNAKDLVRLDILWQEDMQGGLQDDLQGERTTMIDTSKIIREDRHEAYHTGRLSVYMEGR